MFDIFENKQELAFFPTSAEKLLTHIPPFYAAERKHIFIRIASTVVLFILLLPYALTDILRRLRIRKLRQLAMLEHASMSAPISSKGVTESEKITKTGKKNKKTTERKTEDTVTNDEHVSC